VHERVNTLLTREEVSMKPVRTFKVHPSLPEALLPLLHIAYNLRWSWDHAAIELFRRLDHDLWEKCGHNPVLLLGMVEQAILEAAAADDSFLAHMRGVAENLDLYLSGQGAWFRREQLRNERSTLRGCAVGGPQSRRSFCGPYGTPKESQPPGRGLPC
jgi:uncharacterized protein DUF3417